MAPYLLHHLIAESASARSEAEALCLRGQSLSYGGLATLTDEVASGFAGLGLRRHDRVAVLLSKSFAFVAACFGATRTGCVFVPINPALRPGQVAHLLRDCDVVTLVTSAERVTQLADVLGTCPALRHVVIATPGAVPESPPGVAVLSWAAFIAEGRRTVSGGSDNDMAAILYTSGSTGMPKGVVVSHRAMVSGATSVASYLQNHPGDRLLAVLPFSFDAGFSQLTTAFLTGAAVVLLDYLVPHEALRVMEAERITGLTAVPPLWIELSGLDWPASIDSHLRYFASTGGRMPRAILQQLRARAPSARPYLMYGLTEAFRSTYLPPEEVDRRPDSIGRAIPNQEVLVLRPDGSVCDPGEAGELVHRGSTVASGYWNDPQRTSERFRPLPGRPGGLPFAEMAVFSGDTVMADSDGYLYFVGRSDEMIKVSGYRISPTEIEEALYSSGRVAEAAVAAIPDARDGHAIVAWVLPSGDMTLTEDEVRAVCRERLARYMQPTVVRIVSHSLPRNGNGKLDRPRLVAELGLSAADAPA